MVQARLRFMTSHLHTWSESLEKCRHWPEWWVPSPDEVPLWRCVLVPSRQRIGDSAIKWGKWRVQSHLRLHLITSVEAVHKLVYRPGYSDSCWNAQHVPAVGRNRRLCWTLPQVALTVKDPLTNAGDKRHRFHPWVGKIPWRRTWQFTIVFLPGESHGQRSLAGFRPQGGKESDTAGAT